MRNGYRKKSVACAILHHLESSLFLGEQRRRIPLILMLYASVKVIVLVWKIMEITGVILDILSALTKTQKQLLWSGKRHWKRTLFTYVIAKSTTNWTSFQGNVNLQISFVRYHRQRGESYLLAKWKHAFFQWKTCQSYALKVPFKTYWTCCILCQKIWTFFGNWPHQICWPSWNHWMSHMFPRLF
jgi:hypothetical protein